MGEDAKKNAWDEKDKAFDEFQKSLSPLEITDFRRVHEAFKKFNNAWWDVYRTEKYGEAPQKGTSE